MVTVLVQRQQREAAMRKERLRAARAAAAELSVQRARAYATQKQQQEARVHEDARQLWVESRLRDVAAIDGLVQRAVAVRGEAVAAAASLEAELQSSAREEATAWQAERQLESARARLAAAYARAEEHERLKPTQEAAQRRAAVRAGERARAARVVAAVATSSRSVLESLQAPPVATGVPRASIPVAQPMRSPPSATPPPCRPWRLSDAAPHAHVDMYAAPTQRSDDDHAATAAAAADTHAAECAAAQQDKAQLLRDSQERAVQRAASVLRSQHATEQQRQEAQQAHRERLAAVRVQYRHPRRENEDEDDGDGVSAAPAEAASSGELSVGVGGGPRSPPTRAAAAAADAVIGEAEDQSRRQHHRLAQQPTRPTRHQQVYWRGEEAFRAAFVEAPPVVLRRGDDVAPRRAPLSHVLQPVALADLLYTGAAPPHAPAAAAMQQPLASAAVASLDGRPTTAPTMHARVLPSAPLHVAALQHSSVAAVPADAAVVDRSASTGDGGSAPRSPTEPTVSPHQTTPERPAVGEEVVALSPLTPAPPSMLCPTAASVRLPQGQRPQTPVRVPAPRTHADERLGERTPPPPPPLSSASSSSSASPTASRDAAESTSGSSSPTSAVESDAGDTSSSTAATTLSTTLSADSLCASSTARLSMPVMTAEQLKLALLRLRSRITSTQL
ncbi:hypothetical protein NESM_000762700 [Novymonas esmeraldas]|uniref:Uncharacterized protein n=1 Tax=Novymonas esmeraldas TaxID=1808958 RepID=A0AAW0EUY9_9TRYP